MEYKVECTSCGIFMRGSKEPDVRITIFGVCDKCNKVMEEQIAKELADREEGVQGYNDIETIFVP
jgi:predicted secreted protein